MRRLHARGGGVCAVCGRSTGLSLEHILSRGQGGDDVEANLEWLCGSGTTGCHGRLENEDAETRRRFGRHLLRKRQDSIDYLRAKLGEVESVEWMRRRLLADLAVGSGR